jgi:Tol biopolymer transport system component
VEYFENGRGHALHRITLDGEDHILMTWPDFGSLQDIAGDGRKLVVRTIYRPHVYGHDVGAERDLDLTFLEADNVSDLSPDGRNLLFTDTLHGDETPTIFLRPLDGTAAVSLGTGAFPRFWPDGKAVVTGWGPHNVIPIGSGAIRELPREALAYESPLSFTPDGRKLVFEGSEPGQRKRIYVQDTGGGKPRALSAEGTSLYRGTPAVSPDGRQIVGHDAESHVAIQPMSGGSAHVVPSIKSTEYPLGWTADSAGLYVAADPFTSYVDVVDITTGARQPFAPLGGAFRRELGMRVHIAPDGRAWTYTIPRFDSDLFLLKP